jgi:hypothetical protein
MQNRVGTVTKAGTHSSRHLYAGAGILALSLSLSAPSFAQDAFDDAPLLFIDVGTALRFEDNLITEDEFSLDTSLSAGFFVANTNRRASFEAGLVLQTLEGEQLITDPFVTASYAIFNRETELSFDFDYRRIDLDDDVLDDDFDADDLIDEGGTRERLEAQLGLVTGRFAPFGTSTQLRYRLTTFSPEADEDDERLYSLNSTLFFRFNPQVTLRGTAFLSRTDDEDVLNTEQTVVRYGVGADLSIDRVWTATLDLSFTERQTEINGALPGSRIVEEVDGLGASAVVTRDMRNGTYTFSASRVVDDTGFQDTYRVRRALALSNGGTLDASVGLTNFEGADPILIYSLAYSNEILRGLQFTTRLDRSGAVSDDDENITRTQLQAGLTRDLTARSSLSFDTTLLQVEDFSLGGTDTARVNLALSYRHALTEDWNLAARVSRQITYDDGDREDQVDILSLGIERRFSFRP